MPFRPLVFRSCGISTMRSASETYHGVNRETWTHGRPGEWMAANISSKAFPDFGLKCQAAQIPDAF